MIFLKRKDNPSGYVISNFFVVSITLVARGERDSLNTSYYRALTPQINTHVHQLMGKDMHFSVLSTCQ